MLTPLEKALLLALIAATVVAFFLPILRRVRIVRSGLPERRLRSWGGPLRRVLSKVFLQRCTLRSERPATGLMHALIFYGALMFDTMTVNHTLEGLIDGFHLFGAGGFGLSVSLAVDAAAVSVMAGVLFLAFRRFVLRPEAYDTTPGDSAVIYLLITMATATFLYHEAFSIALHPGTERLSFIGARLAAALRASDLAPEAVAAHVRIAWWAHLVAVYGFIAYVPHSKYLHMFVGPLNVLFGGKGRGGRLEPLDLETNEVFGLEKPADLTWKDDLDAFACMECGRCQDACPAFAAGKPLSPKRVLFNIERALLANDRALRAGDRAGQPDLVPATLTEGEIWACTTCGACEKVCPVEIEHIRKLVGARRARVLMSSEFPKELHPLFRNLETNFNPWGMGFAERADGTEALGVPHVKDVAGAEWLLWVGCMGAFDEGGKSAVGALVDILRAAGMGFGTLGVEEKCCGDPARRLGHEYLFQNLARENVSLFRRYGVRRIVTVCPHGANTFKNEYTRLLEASGGPADEDAAVMRNIEVLSHVELIHGLLAAGRITLNPEGAGTAVFHDPCYLARHNAVIEEPRGILAAALGARPRELPRHGLDSFCCGAGGGLMWTEESGPSRVNHLRAEEIIASGGRLAVSACPFCRTMLSDGLRDKGRADVRIEDIARIVAGRLSRAARAPVSSGSLGKP